MGHTTSKNKTTIISVYNISKDNSRTHELRILLSNKYALKNISFLKKNMTHS